MLEGWTTLGYMAAHSQRARLGLMVGGVHYRNPGLWVKAATTLDVLSGGRAWLGIGAAWNQAESEGLGFPWPQPASASSCSRTRSRSPTRMWQGERGTEEDFQGRQFHATRLLNVPQSISRPRVPIMIGGGGEKKTLRLVAQYADASNLFGGPEQLLREVRDPGRALRGGRARLHRDRADEPAGRRHRERRGLEPGARVAGCHRRALRPPRRGRRPARHRELRRDARPGLIELLGSRVLPQLRDIEAADPRQVTGAASGGA